MRMIVDFHDEERTRATVTFTPSWFGRLFGRLFGRRPRTAHVHMVSYLGWRYDVDDTWIGSDLEKRVNQSRRWQEVRALPAARVERRRRTESSD